MSDARRNGATPISAVLFDFDFTLADLSEPVIECVNFALRGLGLPEAPTHEVMRTIGLHLSDTLVELAGAEHRPRAKVFLDLFEKRSDIVMVEGTEVYDDVPDAVAALKERGMRLGIVSTKYRRRIEKILDRDGLLSSFDTIIGGDDVTRHKLDPQPIHMALASLGVPVDKAVYVGDSLPDAQAAQAAGVRFVAALSGTTELHEFEEYAMAGYVSTVNRTDFVEVLERISNGSS